jgi:hypothetical protein
MKKLLAVLSLFLFSCNEEIGQLVTYDEKYGGLCVRTFIYEDNKAFNARCCYLHPSQIDSVKKVQMNMAKEFLKIVK